MKHTQKGEGMSLLGMIGGLILMAIVVGGAIMFFVRGNGDAGTIVSTHVAGLKLDIDQDGLVDQTDKSPCVAGQDVMMGSDGIQYYVFGDAIVIDGVDHGCDKQYYDEYYPDLVNTGVVLELKHDASTGKALCIYPKKTCDEKRYEAYKEWEDQQKNS